MKKAVFKGNKIHEQNIVNHESRESYRLNKYISDKGVSSRREADRLIEQGLVYVNGEKAIIGMQIYEGDKVVVNGVDITTDIKKVYLMLHKPTGITCTNDLNIKGNIRAYVNYPELVFPIGRLDKDSSGLIFLTNDGDIVNKILRAENNNEKEYVVTVDKDITDEFIKEMEQGVIIYNQVGKRNQKTLRSEVTKSDNRTFKLIIRQGLNRQIRRMTKALGYNVISLKRIRIMDVRLGNLEVGEYRYLTNKELELINSRISK